MTKRSVTEDRIRVAVLGSTGSIGVNTLRVIERHLDRFQIVVLAANRSADALEEQARRHPSAQVILCDRGAYADSGGTRSDWIVGRDHLLDSVTRPDVDIVVNGLVGFAGLEPSLRALASGKRLALANKESLVAGGELMVRALKKGEGQLIPIDSEHSAVTQCLGDRPTSEVERVILTASGGPFRGWSAERLAKVCPSDALQHPTWDMGAKITVDSATLANKALEVIEAHFLYGLPYDRIDTVVHPQSIVHSLVEFIDGSVIAQMGFPNMELPIIDALTYPERVADAALRTFDAVNLPPLTFEAIELERFPLFGIGSEAGKRGGTAPTVFNAANEVAVAAFLAEEVSFPMIADIVGETLARFELGPATELGDVLAADQAARRMSREIMKGGHTAARGYVTWPF